MKMKKKNITLVAICLFAVLMIPLGCKKDFLTQTNQQTLQLRVRLPNRRMLWHW